MRAFHALERLEVSAYLVDARGRACPQPIIDLAKALKTQPLVELWADDPAAQGDLDAFCAATGHLLLQCGSGSPLRAVIRHRS